MDRFAYKLPSPAGVSQDGVLAAATVGNFFESYARFTLPNISPTTLLGQKILYVGLPVTSIFVVSVSINPNAFSFEIGTAAATMKSLFVGTIDIKCNGQDTRHSIRFDLRRGEIARGESDHGQPCEFSLSPGEVAELRSALQAGVPIFRF